MLPSAKVTDKETETESSQVAAGSDPSPGPAQVVCDLSEAGAFTQRYNTLHVPVLAAFGGDRLHQCGISGRFDLDRAIAEHAAVLYRSVRRLSRDDSQKPWDDLTFRFGPRSYLYADETRVVGYADTPGEAERLVSDFVQAYSKPPEPKGGVFHLIKTGRDITTEVVPLGFETILSDETLGLHYGQGGLDWHREFSGKLRATRHGLSIFEGPPGTGKTSYLRHLMGELSESHRFYFIPPATMAVLSHPEFIGFWADQRRRHGDRKFVVVLEDSDAALLARGSDNRDQVSAILNLTDGMLADFLRLQIICTINCRVGDLDPALLRPGRLLCHRVFRRLEYADASRLAASLGRTLSAIRDYSLAEVFADTTPQENHRRCIGFTR